MIRRCTCSRPSRATLPDNPALEASSIENNGGRREGEYAILPFVPVRQCRVSFRDQRGCAHETEVTAESLFEAAGMALLIFEQQGFIGDEGVLDLEVDVKAPATVHHVPVARARAWLQSSGRTPKEQAVKSRLRRH
jgi:hypothetical protein